MDTQATVDKILKRKNASSRIERNPETGEIYFRTHKGEHLPLQFVGWEQAGVRIEQGTDGLSLPAYFELHPEQPNTPKRYLGADSDGLHPILLVAEAE